MKKEISKNGIDPDAGKKSAAKPGAIDRRNFIKVAGAGALAFSIVPRHVLGGTGFIAPSDKLTMAYVGCGTQGLRELLPLLAVTDVQVIAVCDPNRDAVGYRDWDKNGLRNEIRKAINQPDWLPGGENIIPGGREVGKNVVDAFYGNIRKADNYKACNAYADYRELLEKEKYSEDTNDDVHYTHITDVRKLRDIAQTFYSRCNRDRRGNHTIGQQRRATYHGRKYSPFAMPADQCK